MSYPPSHRCVDEPQPEVCDLCGLQVPAARLALSDVEGLRGHLICDVTPGCREFRSAPSFNDKKAASGGVIGTTGNSRVHDGGAERWWR